MTRRKWKFYDGLLLAGLLALAVAATAPIWADMFGTALAREEQSHILMAIPLAAWLVWLRRDRLRYIGPEWSPVGPALIIAGWLASSLGFRNGIEIAWHTGAIMITGGAVLTVTGLHVAWRFLPAVAALVFLIPIPGRLRQVIAIPLQEASARITEATLHLVGVAVERAGNVLVINEHPVAVAEACNGMRMVATLALLSFAFVFSMPMRPGIRVLILVSSPVIALLVNVIRLVPTTLMYGYADPAAADLFHTVGGWAVLGLAVLLLWVLLLILRWLDVPTTPYAGREAIA